jgi:hypothetical protein
MMPRIKNIADHRVIVAYGATRYRFEAGETLNVEQPIVDTCLKHNDYKDCFEVMVKGEEEPEAVQEPETVPDPWENEDWNPQECDGEEIIAYAEKNGLIIDPEDADGARQVIVEHFMS